MAPLQANAGTWFDFSIWLRLICITDTVYQPHCTVGEHHGNIQRRACQWRSHVGPRKWNGLRTKWKFQLEPIGFFSSRTTPCLGDSIGPASPVRPMCPCVSEPEESSSSVCNLQVLVRIWNECYNLFQASCCKWQFNKDSIPFHRLGGPDPLDYISMYLNEGDPENEIPPHWHYVSFGLSDLHGDGRVHPCVLYIYHLICLSNEIKYNLFLESAMPALPVVSDLSWRSV